MTTAGFGSSFCVCNFAFMFLQLFFFFPAAAHLIRGQRLLFMWTVTGNFDFSAFLSVLCLCVQWTVYRTYTSYFWVIFSLKLGLTVLFIYLKIILLQCFQFSVFNFNKISSIQTDPTSFFVLAREYNIHFRLKFKLTSKVLGFLDSTHGNYITFVSAPFRPYFLLSAT